MVLTVVSGNTETTLKPHVDYCRVFGTVYFEKKKEMAEYSVFVTSTEAFADVIVYLEENQLMADDSGLWHITTDREFADHIIYIEKEESFADFVIFYTKNQAYATCN